MEDIFNQAIAALKALPQVDRERISWEIIKRLEDKGEWDAIVGTSQAQDWLAKTADQALAEYHKVTKRLAIAPLAACTNASLREEAYWAEFDDLPGDMRKLAEKNFRLWQDNPSHPSLRFKQIHKELPVFSFRVGMRHRTVGVQAPDNKIAWFWIGSFGHFKDVITDT